MTRDEAIQQGQEAARMLDDPIMKAAFQALEEDAVEAMISADVMDDRARLQNAFRVQAIRDLRQQLRSVITTGQQVAAENQR